MVENNIKRLKSIVGLYRKTTENLIADYISAEPPKETVGGDTYGEVAIELSTQIHPTTGELDGKIRGNKSICVAMVCKIVRMFALAMRKWRFRNQMNVPYV